MITPETFIIALAVYLGVSGVFYILLSIMKSEKTVRTHYGVVEGIAGLITLGVAIAMVVF